MALFWSLVVARTFIPATMSSFDFDELAIALRWVIVARPLQINPVDPANPVNPANPATSHPKLTSPAHSNFPSTHDVCCSYAIMVGGGAPAGGAPAAKGGAAPAAKKASDDFDDLFGDDDDAPKPAAKSADDDIFNYGEGEEGDAEEQAAAKARRERMALAKKLKEEADAKAGKTKKAEKGVEKSLVVLDIKPWEADTDLEAVWKMITAQTQEGLTWGETFKLEPVAFGIKKLVMTATIVDSLVLMDDITDKIEALEDHVQSVQVASMNKL